MITEEEKTLTFENKAEEARAVIHHQNSNLLTISGEGDEDTSNFEQITKTSHYQFNRSATKFN